MAPPSIVLPTFQLVSILFRPPKNPFHELGIVLSGSCNWTFPGRPPLCLKSSEAVLIPPNQVHHEQQPTDAPTRLAWLGFSLPTRSALPLLNGLPSLKRLRLDAYQGEILTILERIQQETVTYHEDGQLRIGLAIAELLLLVRRCQQRAAAPLVRPRGQLPAAWHAESLDDAATYLESHCTEDLRMEAVARNHALSASHFAVLFRQRFGCTPKTYVLRCRMNRVQRLMKSGVREVKVLADQCGFTDASHFCKWFKQRTGQTPLQFALRTFGRKQRYAPEDVELMPFERHTHVHDWVKERL